MYNPFEPLQDEWEDDDPFEVVGDLRMRRAAMAGFQAAQSSTRSLTKSSGPQIAFASGRDLNPSGKPPPGSPPPGAGPAAPNFGGTSSGQVGGQIKMGPPVSTNKSLLEVFDNGQKQSSVVGSGKPAFERRTRSPFTDSSRRGDDETRYRRSGGGGGRARKGAAHPVRSNSSEALKLAVGQTHSPYPQLPKMTPAMRAAALSSGAQAAVVKLISTGGGRASAAAMLAYNSRDAAEAVELHDGSLVLTIEDQKKLLDEWEQDFEKRNPSRDVTTLTISFDRTLNEGEKAALHSALTAELANQRLATGIGQDLSLIQSEAETV